MEQEKHHIVPQYRIELTLNDEITNNQPATVSINAADEQTAKHLVTKMLGNETKFVQQEQAGNSVILHPKVLGGKAPCGWLSKFTLPERFGVEAATEYRLNEQQRKAA